MLFCFFNRRLCEIRGQAVFLPYFRNLNFSLENGAQEGEGFPERPSAPPPFRKSVAEGGSLDPDFSLLHLRNRVEHLLARPPSGVLSVLVAQSCPVLCKPMDYSPPGSSVHGIIQARILEWVAILFSRGSSQPRDRPQVSRIAVIFFTV